MTPAARPHPPSAPHTRRHAADVDSGTGVGSGMAGHRSRLTPDREVELYAVTLALLADVGYEALTMDAVAHEAHTSKATIYRQWQGKAGLVLAALRRVKDPDEPLPDTGSLRGDLRKVAASMGSVAVDQGRLIAAAGHAMQVDPELAAAVRERIVAPGMAKLDRLLRRAVERGEVAPGHPGLDWVPEVLIAAFLARPMIEGLPAGREHLAALVDAVVLPALGVAPTPAAPTPASPTECETGTPRRRRGPAPRHRRRRPT